jgi:proliferating cell nuclear antigen
MTAGRRSKKQVSLEPLSEKVDSKGSSPSTVIDKDKVSISDASSPGNFSEYVPNEDHLLEMRTLSGNTFKNLLDTLKSVLNEANIIFTEKGLKLAAVDTNKHALVHLFMDASSFEFYHCKQRLVLGVNIDLLHKVIRCNKLNDMMCFLIKKENTKILEISFENQGGTRTCDRIELLTLPEYNIFDKIEYCIPPEWSSHSFQSICREMSSFGATLLEIQSKGDQLIFSNRDGMPKRQVTVPIGSVEGVPIEDAKGCFLLPFLKSFAKAANLSPRVRIFLKNDSPLICEYSIAGLGTLKYVLTSEE